MSDKDPKTQDLVAAIEASGSVSENGVNASGRVNLGNAFFRFLAPVRYARGIALEEIARGENPTHGQAALTGPTIARLEAETRNIQAITEKAQIYLPAPIDIPSIESGPISESTKTTQDWKDRFLSDAQDVSDDDIQHLYAKILASEYASPGSVSKQTLRVLRYLDKSVAETFTKLRPLVVRGMLIPRISESPLAYIEQFGFAYRDILELIDAGLVGPSDDLAFPLQSVGEFAYQTVHDRIFRWGPLLASAWAAPGWGLTVAGRELARIISYEVDDQVYDALLSLWSVNTLLPSGWAPRPNKEISFDDLSRMEFHAPGTPPSSGPPV